MRDLFLKFAENPDRDSYLAIRKRIVESEDYRPDSDELERADVLLDEEKFEEARTCLQGALPNLLLSPQAHLLLAAIAEEIGEPNEEEMEDYLATSCAEGILATGDGSKEQPYLVLRYSDAYDLLEYLGKEPTEENQVEEGTRICHRIDCSDGTEMWFDVSDLHRKLESPPEE